MENIFEKKQFFPHEASASFDIFPFVAIGIPGGGGKHKG